MAVRWEKKLVILKKSCDKTTVLYLITRNFSALTSLTTTGFGTNISKEHKVQQSGITKKNTTFIRKFDAIES